MSENIFPELIKSISREKKQELLNQKGKVIWFTGLSGSGKSTLATAIETEFYKQKKITQLLDGDEVRYGINNDLGFSGEDRKENIRRVAEVAKLFCECGIITICAFISPTNDIRDMARDIIGEKDFFEIFLNTPLDICEQRDLKGLYKRARAGELKNFTGIDAPFEYDEKADLFIDTSKFTVEECIDMILKKLGEDKGDIMKG